MQTNLLSEAEVRVDSTSRHARVTMRPSGRLHRALRLIVRRTEIDETV